MGVTDKLDGAYATVPVKESVDKELDPDDKAVHGGEAVLEPKTFNVMASMKVVESPIRSFIKIEQNTHAKDRNKIDRIKYINRK